jgi:hypothetical protein
LVDVADPDELVLEPGEVVPEVPVELDAEPPADA